MEFVTCLIAIRQEVATDMMDKAREAANEVTQKFVEIFKQRGVSLIANVSHSHKFCEQISNCFLYEQSNFHYHFNHTYRRVAINKNRIVRLLILMLNV